MHQVQVNSFVGPLPQKPVIARRRDGKTPEEKLEFDKFVATYYMNKINSCKTRGIAFNLTITQVKNMLRAKKCQYTGIDLTHTASGTSGQRPTDVTIERINPSLPYQTGNVCAVSYAANQAKSAFDMHFGKNSTDMLHMMSKKIKEKSK